MNPLHSIANRHFLAALIALGVVNVLLCVVMVLRENTNNTNITRLAKLSDELAESSKNHRRDMAEFVETTRVKDRQTDAALQQRARELEQARGALAKLQSELDEYHEKHPWLFDPDKPPPWVPQLKALSKRLHQVELFLDEMN